MELRFLPKREHGQIITADEKFGSSGAENQIFGVTVGLHFAHCRTVDFLAFVDNAYDGVTS
jgi:hypothetical protein